MAGLYQRTLLDGNDIFTEFKGALGIYYYTNDRGSCEVDFVVDAGGLG